MFGEKQDQIDQLLAENEQLQADNIALKAELDRVRQEARTATDEAERVRHAAMIQPAVEAAIKAYFDEPNIIELATEMARKKIIEDEKAKQTEQLTERLQQEQDARVRAKFRAEEAPALKAQLKQQFEDDGTFDTITETVTAEEQAKIDAETREAYKAQVMAELSSPEEHARVVADFMALVKDYPEMVRFRAKYARELEQGWQQEATRAGELQIRDEEAARGPDYITDAMASYLVSQAGKKARERVRTALETEWNKKSIEEVAKQLHDEELTALLQDRAAKAKQELERSSKTADLLKDFMNGGIDTKAIPADDTLLIHLGSIQKGSKDVRTRDAYGGYNTTKKATIEMVSVRQLSLISLGDGRFMVHNDSLADVSPTDPYFEYLQNDIIEQGTVIVLGRKVTENGKERLDQRISAGSELYIDDDTEKPGIRSLGHEIANVVLDGVQARSYDEIVKPHL